jgi:hypothetical protein
MRMIVDQIVHKLGVIVAKAFSIVTKAKEIGVQYYLPSNLFDNAIIAIGDFEDME